MSYTPQTDKLYDSRHETDILSAYYLMRDLAKRLEIERNDACHSWRISSVCRKLAEERDEWKQKYIQQNKDLGCEMMDPNGTIWDYAKRLQDELENLKASTIHTCHDQCQRQMCVMRRQRDALGIIAGELVAMIRVNVMRGTFEGCTVEQIDEHLKPWIDKIAALKGGTHE